MGDRSIGKRIQSQSHQWCYVLADKKDTKSWANKTGWFDNSTEEYYAKVKIKGESKYIIEESAQIVFDFEEPEENEPESEKARPLKLDENDIELSRYELCRFTKLEFKDENETKKQKEINVILFRRR